MDQEEVEYVRELVRVAVEAWIAYGHGGREWVGRFVVGDGVRVVVRIEVERSKDEGDGNLSGVLANGQV